MGTNSSKESLSDASTVIDKTGYANDVADRSNFYTFEYDNKENEDQDYIIDETIVGTPFSRADSLHAAETRDSKDEKEQVIEVHVNSVELPQVETIANKENLKSDIVKKSKKKKKGKKMHRSRKSSHGSNRDHEEKGRHVHMVVYFYSDDPNVSTMSKEEENVVEMIEETDHGDVRNFNEDNSKQSILEDDDLMTAVTSIEGVVSTPTLDDSTEI